jgi:DNA repair exonuclease SbcCD ATPase subunit
VTSSRKGAKSRRHGRNRSAGTKATTRVGQVRKTRADLEQQLEKYRRELTEAREQQTATSEVLRIISSSPGELKPVFNAVLENAVRLCEAKFGVLYRYDGNLFHPEALVGVPQALVEFHQRRGAFQAVPGTPLHRLWQTRNVVHKHVSLQEDPYMAPLAPL